MYSQQMYQYNDNCNENKTEVNRKLIPHLTFLAYCAIKYICQQNLYIRKYWHAGTTQFVGSLKITANGHKTLGSKE